MMGYEPWWHWRPTHDVAFLLSKHNRVIFVEPQPRFEALRRSGESWRMYLTRFGAQRLEWVNENLAVRPSPPMLPRQVSILSRLFPHQVVRLSVKCSKLLEARLLRWQLARAGVRPTVLLVYHPLDLLLVGRIGAKVNCWNVYDEVSLFQRDAADDSGVMRELVVEVEDKHIQQVDVIFASSRGQYERRRRIRSDVHFVPNGVDFDLFHRALTSYVEEPQDLKMVPRPRLIFAGGIDWRLDFELLEGIAGSRPEWTLVFIGLVRQSGEAGAKMLQSYKNVHFLGLKDHEHVPAYLRWSDVGLMPYRVNTGSSLDYAYPTKMPEYMAAGLPVVSTALPEVLAYSEVVHVGSDTAEFISLVDRALTRDSPKEMERREAVARQHCWDKLLEVMCEQIEGKLVARRGPRA